MCMYKPETVEYKAVFGSEREYEKALENVGVVLNEEKLNGKEFIGMWRFCLLDKSKDDFSFSISVYEDVGVEDGTLDSFGITSGKEGLHDGPETTMEYMREWFGSAPKKLLRKREGKETEEILF